MRDQGNEISPNTRLGMETPMLRNSMPKASVAAACMKVSMPPVTSNWLIGSLSNTGRITSTCSSTPSTDTTRMAAAKAANRFQPKVLVRKNTVYMPIIISSA